MSNSVAIQTFLQLSSNMLTTSELRQYVIAAYGTQVSGQSFTSHTVNNWVAARKVPEAYGGHKITSAMLVQPFRVTVLTLTDFDRTVLEDMKLLKTAIKGPKIIIPKKLRTKLYYEILNKKKPAVTLDSLRAAGVKGNQLRRKKTK